MHCGLKRGMFGLILVGGLLWWGCEPEPPPHFTLTRNTRPAGTEGE